MNQEIVVSKQQEVAIEFVRALEEAGALTPTALVLTDGDMSYERFEALCFFLGRLNRSCAWWVGDLLNFGDSVHGAYAYQAAEVTGLAPQTLANRQSVCKHIPPERRRASLPFGVHAEVAYLEPDERDRWLDRAELGSWTRAKLREEMRSGRGLDIGPDVRSGKTSKIDADISDVAHEEHPLGVPAAEGDFLGELVSGPVNLEVVAVQITTALAWVPLERQGVIVQNLRPDIQQAVRGLLDEDHY